MASARGEPGRAAAVARSAAANLEAARQALRAALAQAAPVSELEAMDDAAFQRWFEQRMAAYPRRLLILPDGRRRLASPWPLALAFVEGGQDVIDRYLRVVHVQELHRLNEESRHG